MANSASISSKKFKNNNGKKITPEIDYDLAKKKTIIKQKISYKDVIENES
jgi:hypothetical protein